MLPEDDTFGVETCRRIFFIYIYYNCATGLAYLEDPECYAGGSVATGRVSLAGQDEGERSDEERYLGPPGWGLRRWTSTPTHEKMLFS
jgi:hypothetical protein